MKQIALVGVALGAINPIMEPLKKMDSNICIYNYLDSYLLQQVEKDDGVITPKSLGRMFDMLVKACDDGADGIIITCTIFSAYAETFSQLLHVPVISPDGAMMDAAIGKGGSTAILCTFRGTVETTKGMFSNYQNKHNVCRPFDMILLEDAFEAARQLDMERFDRLIQEKIHELDARYDNILLAQISMARAAKNLTTSHARVWTSPESAIALVLKLLEEHHQKGES